MRGAGAKEFRSSQWPSGAAGLITVPRKVAATRTKLRREAGTQNDVAGALRRRFVGGGGEGVVCAEPEVGVVPLVGDVRKTQRLTCRFKLDATPKRRPQHAHWYAAKDMSWVNNGGTNKGSLPFSPVWTSRCFFNVLGLSKRLWHIVHACLRSRSVTASMVSKGAVGDSKRGTISRRRQGENIRIPAPGSPSNPDNYTLCLTSRLVCDRRHATSRDVVLAPIVKNARQIGIPEDEVPVNWLAFKPINRRVIPQAARPLTRNN